MSDPPGKFWRRGDEDDYVEIYRRGDDDLVIEIEDGSDFAHVVLPQAAESLLQWLDRSR